MLPRIDRTHTLETLADLVRIESINPTLTPGGAGEAVISAYVANWLEQLGLDVTVLEPESGQPSVVARLKGRGRGRSLMLCGHLDTVGVEGMSEPFSANVRDGKLFGRGAYDMKGGLVACMATIKALVDTDEIPQGDVLFAGVADEEYASKGMEAVLERYSVDGAIVTEPTELEICVAHKGFVWLEVEAIGQAAHGSYFDQGIDAIQLMGRLLSELEGHSEELLRRPPHALVGVPSIHASTIVGGSALNIYPAYCKLEIERRTVPGEMEADVVAELQALIDRIAESDTDYARQVVLRSFYAREPFEVDPEASIVNSVNKAAHAILGKHPKMVGKWPWMDAALLMAAGVETAVIGPIGDGAHACEEWVDLESVLALGEILVGAALDYCV